MPDASVGDTKGERTRRRILDAAAKLLAVAGATDVSVSDVAAEIGLRPASVYFHFDSRDALVDQVLLLGMLEATAHLDAAIAVAAPGPASRLRAAVGAHFDARRDQSDYAAVVLGIGHRVERAGGGEYGRLRRRYNGTWLELITSAQTAGDLDADLDPRLVRDLILGAANAPLAPRRRAAEAARTLIVLIGLKD